MNEEKTITPAEVLTPIGDVELNCVKCGAITQVPAFLTASAKSYGVLCNTCCDLSAAEILKSAVALSKEIRAQQWTRVCPSEYQNTEAIKLPKGNRLAKLMAWEYGPRGFFLIGKTRAGKSRCAWLLAKREFLAGKSVRCLDYSAAFDYGSRFHDGVKDVQQWIEKYCACDVLLLDDVFKAKLSDSFEQALFIVIARRTETQKPMIVTANDNFDTLKSRMTADRGPAIVERLKEFCQVTVFGL